MRPGAAPVAAGAEAAGAGRAGTAPAAPPRADLGALAGYYTHAESDVPLHLVLRGDHLALLAGGRGQRLLPLGGLRFRLGGTRAEVEFEAGGTRGGRTGSGPTLHVGGAAARVYRHAAPARPPAARMAAYAGTYHSVDLDVIYRLRAEGLRLTLRHRKLGEIRLTPTFDGGFYGGGWYFTFERGTDGEMAGFTMSTPRARRIRFRRQAEQDAGRHPPVEPWPGACSEPAAPVRCGSGGR